MEGRRLYGSSADGQEPGASGAVPLRAFRLKITANYLQRQFKVVDARREWLADHNNKALLMKIKRGR
jgi:hypothetical protein